MSAVALFSLDHEIKKLIEDSIKRTKDNYLEAKRENSPDASYLKFLFRNYTIDQYRFFEDGVELFVNKGIKVTFMSSLDDPKPPHIFVGTDSQMIDTEHIGIGAETELVGRYANGDQLCADVYKPKLTTTIRVEFQSFSRAEAYLMGHWLNGILIGNNEVLYAAYEVSMVGFKSGFAELMYKDEKPRPLFAYRYMLTYRHLARIASIRNFKPEGMKDFKVTYNLKRDGR